MPPKQSSGILLYRKTPDGLQVLLAHPGGPFFARKDEGSWSLPKGEIEDGEPPETTAVREFEEETGVRPDGPLIDLGQIKQKGGKTVFGFACEGDYDVSTPPCCNTFEIEWPPRSGKRKSFPEIDRAEFYSLEEARRKINPAQAAFLDRLVESLEGA